MKKLEHHLSEPVVGSCLVIPKGAAAGAFAGAVLGGAAGAAGRAAADTAASAHGRDKAPIESGTASLGLLALTADEVVLVNGRRGVTRPVATGLAARASRTQLRDAELGSGRLTAPLRLTWADGSCWELDVPRAEGRKARSLLDQLVPAA
jgi:hypothetical protein